MALPEHVAYCASKFAMPDEPDEVAAFLASGAADMINGADLVVDGATRSADRLVRPVGSDHLEARRIVMLDTREWLMRVDTKDGGDGVKCWNRQAIRSYADTMDDRERQLGARNPDLMILPGLVKCYGCEVMEYDYGTKCTAQLTLTRYAVEGEVEPRADDAKASLAEIPGLLTRAPESATPQPTPGGVEAPARPVTLPQHPEPVVRRKLFGRAGR